jgi:hypothetical protein
MRGTVRTGRLLEASQIKAWLAPTGHEVDTECEADIRFLLGADGDTLPLQSRCAMPFVLAVLRDIYPDDADVLHWLTRARPETSGMSALDLLTTGLVSDVEHMLVRAWNQPRKLHGRLTYVRKLRIT